MNDQSNIPPHDIDAECAVLSAVMINGGGGTVDEVASLLKPSDFYSHAHELIFSAFLDLHAVGRPVDVVTVIGRLRDLRKLDRVGGAAYPVELLNAAPGVTSERLKAYAETVAVKSRMRACIAMCQQIASEGYAFAGDGNAFLDAAEARMLAATHRERNVKLYPYVEIVREVGADLRDAAKSGLRLKGLSTGYPALDERIHGLQEGRLHIIAARPSLGKSALAANIATTVCKTRMPDGTKNHVMFFTLEMDKKELCGRILSAETSVDQNHMLTNNLTESDWRKLIAGAAGGKDLNIHICDSAEVDAFDINTHARRIRHNVEMQAGRLALIVVDYLQLMDSRSGKKSETREQEISGISRSLKKLAQEMACPVIALSQLNRGVEARSGGDSSRPRLSDLRESGAIEQDADVVLLIHKEKAAKPSSFDKAPVLGNDVHEVIVAKARGGKAGGQPVRLKFEGRYTRFDAIEADQAWEAAQ